MKTPIRTHEGRVALVTGAGQGIGQSTIWSLKARRRAECLVSHGQGAKLLAAVSATSSSFEMTEYPACTSILIPTIRARTRRGFGGVRTVSGETREGQEAKK